MSATAAEPPAVIGRLRRRPEFLHAQAGRKAVRDGFILRARVRRKGNETGARTGLTVSRKVGGAVQRNRIKRRLREVLRGVAPGRAQPGFDYVVIARTAALTLPYETLTRDMASAFVSIHRDARSDRSR